MPVFRPATTDEFWFSPALEHAVPPSRDDDAGAAGDSSCDGDGEGDHGDSMEMIFMPPAHAQLLSGNCPRSAALAGYDHTRMDALRCNDLDDLYGSDADLTRLRADATDGGDDLDGRDDLDGCDDLGGCDDLDGCDELDRPVGRLAAARQRGCGSWLLGSLALLDSARGTPPDLAGASDEDSTAASSRASDGVSGASLSSSSRRVSFAPTVSVRSIPHSSELSPSQRFRMFATAAEVRRNKARNRKEWRYDGGDWRSATEEPDMVVDAVTGEAVHPVHYCEE